MKLSRLLSFSIILAALLFSGMLRAQKTDLPRDFKQIIPRGSIPAITHPQYVPASRAHISDNTWVLGVVINGQARAYSLNLLNNHEIVNDRVGNTPFAAVW